MSMDDVLNEVLPVDDDDDWSNVKQCQTCAHYLPATSREYLGSGCCRRHPPALTPLDGLYPPYDPGQGHEATLRQVDEASATRWPLVEETDACGEHRYDPDAQPRVQRIYDKASAARAVAAARPAC